MKSLIALTFALFSATAGAQTGSFAEQSTSILNNSTIQALIAGAEAHYEAYLRAISIDDRVDQMAIDVHAYNVRLEFQQGRLGPTYVCSIGIGVPIVTRPAFSGRSSTINVEDYCSAKN